MAYEAEISQTNPSCFLFLVDQSGSMEDRFTGGSGQRKADGLADAINRLLQNLVIRCAKDEGMRDYFHVGVIGYGASVGPALGGALAGRELVPISDVGNMPARVEERTKKSDDGAGGIVDQRVRFPIWLDPMANGGTPMVQAFGMASSVLEGWIAAHPSSFPPVVIHISDGESTDGDPTEAMGLLTELSTADGTVLLFNVHLSDNPAATTTAFPDTPSELPDEHARMLFQTSSLLTPFMRSVAREHGFQPTDDARGFVLNADLVLVIQALDIGTRPSNLR